MAEEKLKLQIVTPDRVLYDDVIEMVTFHGVEGEISALYDHTPLTTTLTSGKVTIKNDGAFEYAVLHGGFVEIQEESVTLLTDAAEWAHEIDLDRAKEALKRAEERLDKGYEDESRAERQRASRLRATIRIEVAQFHNDLKK